MRCVDSLGKEQGKFRDQLMENFGTDPMKAIQEQTQRNMAMFADAMKAFNPFAAAMGMPGAKPEAPKAAAQQQQNDFQTLKDQLAAMQKKIDTMTGG